MFPFESFNGRLKKCGYSNNVIDQITENVTIKAVQIKQEETKLEYLSNKIDVQISSLSIVELNAIQRLGDCSFYAAYHKGATIITSISYKMAKKTSDFFVSTQDGRIGKIKYFFKSDVATMLFWRSS